MNTRTIARRLATIAVAGAMALTLGAGPAAACGSWNVCGYDSDYLNNKLFENGADGNNNFYFTNNRLESIDHEDPSNIGWVEADGWPDRTVLNTSSGQVINDLQSYGLDNQIDHGYDY
jgi:hypothetical protein